MVPQDFKANGVKVSLNDLIIKAAATTLQLVPEVNINVVGEAEYRILPNVDISVAVATPNGLITPIVTNAIGKTLPEISSSVRDLALRARDGKLQLNEFQVIINFALLNEVKAIALSCVPSFVSFIFSDYRKRSMLTRGLCIHYFLPHF